jgi:hypothetical protein
MTGGCRRAAEDMSREPFELPSSTLVSLAKTSRCGQDQARQGLARPGFLGPVSLDGSAQPAKLITVL